MAFSRGKYGVEYHRHVSGEPHLLRWVLLGVALLAVVSFFIARSRRKPGPPVLPPETPAASSDVVDSRPARPETDLGPFAARGGEDDASARWTGNGGGGGRGRPQPRHLPVAVSQDGRAGAANRSAGNAAFADKVEGWIASRSWAKAERELLAILRDSERHGNVQGARNAIEKLMYHHPSVEDLKDELVRRFGDLNTQLLFSGTNTPWTATVTVKRGDTLQRIAMEHRTTLEALQRLNPMKDPNRLALGQKLRVLNFPDSDLIVHKQLQFAELLLKKRIFKRYYVTVRDDVEPGAYPVSNETGSRASDRIRSLIRQMTPSDRDELRLFLAPGSRITVTAQ